MLVSFDRACARTCVALPLKVAIDIGHSPSEPGALSASGKYEYYYNERLVYELVEASRARSVLNLSVVNPDRTKLDLRKRTSIAAKLGSDVFISIHHDSANEKYIKHVTEGGIKKEYTENIHGYSSFVSGRTHTTVEA
jgi:N-acetylmuramoyl-L-alanine amidase